MARKSQKDRLIKAFTSGADFTENQIASRLGVSPSRARYLVTELRQDGYAIYRNSKVLSNGNQATTYRLGTPSRAMVSAAARFLGGSLFA